MTPLWRRRRLPHPPGQPRWTRRGHRRAAPGDGVLEGDRARGRGPHRGGSARREGSDYCATDSSSTAAALEEAEARPAQAQADLEAARVASDRRLRPIIAATSSSMPPGSSAARHLMVPKPPTTRPGASHTVKETAVGRFARELALAQRNHEDMVHPGPFAGVVTVKGPAGRDRLTLVRQQRFRAHRHRNDRRHGIAGSRGRRQ